MVNKPIGGGKKEAATSTCSSNGEARGSRVDTKTTTTSVQTRGPCSRPGEPPPAGKGSGRRDAASSPLTSVGG